MDQAAVIPSIYGVRGALRACSLPWICYLALNQACRFRAWFKREAPFSGNSTDLSAAPPRAAGWQGPARANSGRTACGRASSQPVWVGAARQQFYATHTARVLTPHETARGSRKNCNSVQVVLAQMAAQKRNSSRKRLFRFSITLLARTTCPNNSSTAWRTTPYREPPAAPTTPARVATAPAAGSVRLSTSRTSSTSVAGTANSSANAWRSPRRVVSRRPARRPVDSPTDSGPVECGGAAVRLAQPQFRHEPVIQGTAGPT